MIDVSKSEKKSRNRSNNNSKITKPAPTIKAKAWGWWSPWSRVNTPDTVTRRSGQPVFKSRLLFFREEVG